MDPIPSLVEMSFTRSRPRQRATMMLSSLGEASPAQLAKAVGTTHTRLRWMMEGHGEEYSVELAPVTLGLATMTLRGRRRTYTITGKGRKVCRRLGARIERDARRAAAIRRSDETFARGEPQPGTPDDRSPDPATSSG